ncbi:LUD domain-containing protein [Alicyclobacillus mengziensis]|uniref:LUD domain-containing protein n=1 Tax=Alicyclobacillus mengziensis TaxID=2931921 RepID=A0A9X7W3T8_9BACL|nr:LUD domain-containing protein [Alicyclobacillus mengziensis]
MVGVPEFWSMREMSTEAQVERFIEAFTALGGEVNCYASNEELATGLENLLHELAPERVGAWGKDADWAVHVDETLDKWDTVRWDEASPVEFSEIQVAVTGCMAAIADTGTIVMNGEGPQGRGTHVLPLIHIVVLAKEQIRLRLGEVLDTLSAKAYDDKTALPASVHFVSGPSRSSDIENDQSIGVHGPARVIVLLRR